MDTNLSLASFLKDGEELPHDIFYDLKQPLSNLHELLTDHKAWLNKIQPPERRGVDALDYTCLFFRHGTIEGDTPEQGFCRVQGLPACKSLTVTLDLSGFNAAPFGFLGLDNKAANDVEVRLAEAVKKPVSLIVRMDTLTAFLHTEFQNSEHPGDVFFNVLALNARLSTVMRGRKINYGPILANGVDPVRVELAELDEFELVMASQEQLDFRFMLEPNDPPPSIPGPFPKPPCSCLTMIGRMVEGDLDRRTGRRDGVLKIEFTSMVSTIWKTCPVEELIL